MIIKEADLVRWETATFGDGAQFEDMKLHHPSLQLEIIGSGQDERAIITGRLGTIVEASKGWFQDDPGQEQVFTILEESILIRRA